MGDSGLITGAGGEAAISRTIFTPAGQIVHQGKVEQGSLAQDEDVTARVEELRRRGICRSHTATHLLHRALRDLLGEHAAQSGSLVNNDRLRFDFVHFDALTPEEMARLEEDVNRKIIENALNSRKDDPSRSKAAGAVAFDEKYTQEAVRVISAGSYSKSSAAGPMWRRRARSAPLELSPRKGSARGCAVSRPARGSNPTVGPPRIAP